MNCDFEKRVVFVQPFGISAEGGSSRIFQNLFSDRLGSLRVLVYGITKPPPSNCKEEVYIPERLRFGRLERTRFAGMLQSFRFFSWASSRKKIFSLLQRWQPACVHSIIHGVGFRHVYQWSKENRIPHVISVHDDIRHLTIGDPWAARIEKWTAECWRNASVRFVISPEIGEEYERRYGQVEWIQITDGLDSVPDVPRPLHTQRMNIYFAGGMNVPYEPNFLALQAALKVIAAQSHPISPRIIVRGGRRLKEEDAHAPPIEPRPFCSQEEVFCDLAESDILYLPLSIDPRYTNFARFSLSTKMITYLGSGLPIFYHGPQDSAAHQLLNKHDACVSCFSNDPTQISKALEKLKKRREMIVNNALKLGRDKFLIESIRRKFQESLAQTIAVQ